MARLVDPGQLGPLPFPPHLMAGVPSAAGAGLLPTIHYTEQATETQVPPCSIPTPVSTEGLLWG